MTSHSFRTRRDEQRRSPRKSATVRSWLADGLVERYTVMCDLSAGGARVATAGPPAVGREVAISFRLSDLGDEVRASGRVVWRTEGYMGRGGVIGVEFAKVLPPDAIAAYVGA